MVFTPVIPATQGTEGEGKDHPRPEPKTLPEKKVKQKSLGAWFKW
jgi:hypothetical protein